MALGKGGKKLHSIIALLGCAGFQNVPALNNCLALRFPKRYNEPARKIQPAPTAAVFSAGLHEGSRAALGESLNVKEFPVLRGGAMTDDVGLNPCAR